ncbi:hypothetical protein BDW42DRAFT_161201 [Aspergillus taichungensis]|uniref:Uncharacterized protein n=1 Tax=Aspergillus taichungensis TaxID=482145 RepID=A0A2J5I5N5_9EURO|nr:hypothetical protein BDW42DRAFT_161201 [Aspergillus taichungensis]
MDLSAANHAYRRACMHACLPHRAETYTVTTMMMIARITKTTITPRICPDTSKDMKDGCCGSGPWRVWWELFVRWRASLRTTTAGAFYFSYHLFFFCFSGSLVLLGLPQPGPFLELYAAVW